MEIHCIGYNSIYGSGYSVDREGLSAGYMFILAKSRISITADDRTQVYPPDTIVLFDKESRVRYSAAGGVLICDWICFDAAGDKEFMEQLDITSGRPICFSDHEFIDVLIRNIAAEYYSMNSRRVKMIDTLMRTLLLKVSESADVRESANQQPSDPHYSALVELREKVYRNPQMKWNVDTMAAYVNMSRSYFQHIYRDVFGVSCISDVISGKIEKAKELLTETDCTVSQAAAMCGYENEEHFMRQFKKIVGLTPTKYRKK